LQERLPPDLIVLAEEEVVTIGAGESPHTARPDVQIREPWKLKEPVSEEAGPHPPPTVGTDPIRVFLDDEVERWLEIRDASGRLITALELLSPTNKLESADRDRYLRKRRSFLSGGVSLVEIDLVRQGVSVFPQAIRDVLQRTNASYAVSVSRATDPAAPEVYPIGLRERLPAIRVPLRPTDADAILDLQPLIDQCHVRGRYHLLNYRLELNPPLPAEDAAWVSQILCENHLL
jgi:hypothetical protein